MSRLICTMGLQASGKSTYAAKLMESEPDRYIRVNRDFLRSMLHNNVYTTDNETITRMVRDYIIGFTLKYTRKDVISDDCNLGGTTDYLRGLADQAGAEFELVDFTHVPLEECIRRDSLREGTARVGEAVIRRTWENYLKEKA